MQEDKFDMYKNIVNNYFRTETFEKAKELCTRDMVQLNNRYVTEAVCRGETLNRIDALEKEKKNSISKDKIREKIKELEEELIQNYGTLGESLTTTEIKTLKELLGE